MFFFSSRGDERTYRRRRRRSILPPENVETPERDGRDDVGEKEASFERERKRLVLTVLTNSLGFFFLGGFVDVFVMRLQFLHNLSSLLCFGGLRVLDFVFWFRVLI